MNSTMANAKVFTYEMAVNGGIQRKGRSIANEPRNQTHHQYPKGVIVQHKIPTVQSPGRKDLGAVGYGFDFKTHDQSSFGSSGEAFNFGFGQSGSPYLPSRLNQRISQDPFFNNLDENTLNNSQLTNIVLDDFRK